MLGKLLDPQLVESLNHLALGARRVVEGNTMGLHRSPIKGASVEFRQHRLYVPGDEPRRIDWRILARSDRAFVKEFDEETNLRATVFLDASGSMGYGKPGKFDNAVQLVAGLGYLMLAQTEAAGLAIASESEPEYLAPAAATTQLSRLANLLERSQPRGRTVLGETLLRVADRMDRRSLVIVISDLLMPVEILKKGLARLHHDRHELVVMRVLHPDEKTFPFSSWARFAGFEGETSRVLEGPQVRRRYLANFRRHEEELTQVCRTLKADFFTWTIDHPVLDAVMAIVRRQGR